MNKSVNQCAPKDSACLQIHNLTFFRHTFSSQYGRIKIHAPGSLTGFNMVECVLGNSIPFSDYAASFSPINTPLTYHFLGRCPSVVHRRTKAASSN